MDPIRMWGRSLGTQVFCAGCRDSENVFCCSKRASIGWINLLEFQISNFGSRLDQFIYSNQPLYTGTCVHQHQQHEFFGEIDQESWRKLLKLSDITHVQNVSKQWFRTSSSSYFHSFCIYIYILICLYIHSVWSMWYSSTSTYFCLRKEISQTGALLLSHV